MSVQGTTVTKLKWVTLKKAVFAFNCSISNRAQLAKEMHIEKLMKKNKVFELYNGMQVYIRKKKKHDQLRNSASYLQLGTEFNSLVFDGLLTTKISQNSGITFPGAWS